MGWLKEGKCKFGGNFKDELNAAKRVNQVCKELGIPLQNPDISAAPENVLDYGPIKAELQRLIKFLEEKNDPTENAIKENLIATINYGEQTIMREINLQTENGESALSIAAKYDFTNEHHTPLSLAVIHNHFKVVEVLFEEWISPNSHEKPYLHLSPIFQVKSREIAQLLIDNDAVT